MLCFSSLTNKRCALSTRHSSYLPGAFGDSSKNKFLRCFELGRVKGKNCLQGIPVIEFFKFSRVKFKEKEKERGKKERKKMLMKTKACLRKTAKKV